MAKDFIEEYSELDRIKRDLKNKARDEAKAYEGLQEAEDIHKDKIERIEKHKQEKRHRRNCWECQEFEKALKGLENDVAKKKEYWEKAKTSRIGLERRLRGHESKLRELHQENTLLNTGGNAVKALTALNTALFAALLGLAIRSNQSMDQLIVGMVAAFAGALIAVLPAAPLVVGSIKESFTTKFDKREYYMPKARRRAAVVAIIIGAIQVVAVIIASSFLWGGIIQIGRETGMNVEEVVPNLGK